MKLGMMTRTELYKELKDLLALAFDGDDLISQDTLFDLQERLANLTLRIACETNNGKDLVAAFPYLFSEI